MLIFGSPVAELSSSISAALGVSVIPKYSFQIAVVCKYQNTIFNISVVVKLKYRYLPTVFQSGW